MGPKVTMRKEERGLFKSDILVVPESTVTPIGTEESSSFTNSVF
jgi:putative transposon-encoded protein